MKLLTKYNRFNIAVTVIIMLVAGVIYYFTISAILNRQVDKALVVEEREIHDYIAANHHLPQVFRTNHQQITFTPLKAPARRLFIDTVYRDLKDKELEPARALYTWVQVNQQQYQVLVIQSKVETEDLLKLIFAITTGLIITSLIALFLLNRMILGRIWKPFYRMLVQLKAFNLTENHEIEPVASEIDEFKELDRAVNMMAAQVKNEYQTLKVFTENASHELMTPISVINSKLDTLVQTGHFTEPQSKLLNDIYGTVNRLTRLNKSMLLLAKIENRLIQDRQVVDLKKMLTECLDMYDELMGEMQLHLNVSLLDKQINSSLLLTEVLVNNLISNAIRHNRPGGSIEVLLDKQKLLVSNTGTHKAVDVTQSFKRFQKSSASEGIGLGLTICKQICDNYGYQLAYQYETGRHQFTIRFETDGRA